MNKEKLLSKIKNNIKFHENELNKHNSWVQGYIQGLEIIKELIEVGTFDNE